MPFIRLLPLLGPILCVFAAVLLVPFGLARYDQDGVQALFGWCALFTLALGLGFTLAGRRWSPPRVDLQARDGILLVGVVWVLLPAVAAAPIWLYFERSGAPIGVAKAYFEAISGLSTTGSTVLSGLDALPRAINLWRCFIQWLGGMGILVLAVAILPMVGVGGSQLFRAESTGPMKDAKLTPRIHETAKGLWLVYIALSVICLMSYRLGGMSWFDAWCHMFTTVSLGGLSPYDASFGHFQSPTLEWLAVLFMFMASCNFALYFVALSKRQPMRVWRDREVRTTLAVLAGASALAFVLLMVHGTYPDVLQALRMATFHVVSIASTTGFATTDYTLWPVFIPIMMLLLSGVATSAGSTGSGIKMARVILLFKQARREMTRIVHPRAISPLTMGHSVVPDATIFSVLGFMLLYGAVLLALTMVLLLTGMDFETAFSAVVANLNNTGPGLNSVGPAGNYGGLSDFQLWVLSTSMILGRLEIMSFLVLFTPGFWRK